MLEFNQVISNNRNCLKQHIVLTYCKYKMIYYRKFVLIKYKDLSIFLLKKLNFVLC